MKCDRKLLSNYFQNGKSISVFRSVLPALQLLELAQVCSDRKNYRKGGLSVWQIKKLCEDLGFDVEVLEAYPHHCMRSCVSRLYPHRFRYLVLIKVKKKIPNGRFTVTDNVLTRLMSDRAIAFECLLNSYRLAGTSYEIEFLE